MPPRTFYHRGSAGDIIYSLPTVMAMGGGNICLRNDFYVSLLKSLLESQEAIGQVTSLATLPFTSVTHNLDAFRPIARRYRSIPLSICHMLPFGISFDITEKWLHDIPPLDLAEIIVNWTSRYHDSGNVNWSLLAAYERRCAFIGTQKEHTQFQEQFAVKVAYWKCRDAYEIARVIRGAKLFMGNQSLCFAIAEALKHNRILEQCFSTNNCVPQSSNGHIHMSHELIGSYIDA